MWLYLVPTAAAIAADKLQRHGLDASVGFPEAGDVGIPLTVMTDRDDMDWLMAETEPSATRDKLADNEDEPRLRPDLPGPDVSMRVSTYSGRADLIDQRHQLIGRDRDSRVSLAVVEPAGTQFADRGGVGSPSAVGAQKSPWLPARWIQAQASTHGSKGSTDLCKSAFRIGVV